MTQEMIDKPMSTASNPLRLAIIAALTRTNGIGANGTLPWRLPKEMAHFRRATLHVCQPASSDTDRASPMNAVIMGRKTWQSIPSKFRPLSGRINVVVSRQNTDAAQHELGIPESPHTYLCASLESAVAKLQSLPNVSRTFLIGGAQLYAEVMQNHIRNAVIDRLLITRIYDPSFEMCDVFLPEFRTEEQITQEQGEGRHVGLPQQKWVRTKQSDFDAYLGGGVEQGIVEEKGVRYSLQMWERSNRDMEESQ